MSDRVRAVFFETEPWEEAALLQGLDGVDATCHRDRLDTSAASLAADAQVVSVFIRSRVDRALLERLPQVRLLATRSTGFEHVDLRACDERSVAVSNVPRYGENTVAEHTFALILALSRNVHKAYQRTAQGDFSLEGLRGFDLKDRTLGVVGAGSIGLHVVRIARGFGMEVLVYDVHESHLIAEVLGFRYVSLDELLARSDIVTLHAPYTPATHHLISRETLRKMKPSALLINTARGALVDTEALVWALQEGIVGGAGLDVLEGEELIKEESQLLSMPTAEDKLRLLLRNHILMKMHNVVLTPHIAFFSEEALQRIVDCTIDNIRSWLGGRPTNVVNSPRAETGAV